MPSLAFEATEVLLHGDPFRFVSSQPSPSIGRTRTETGSISVTESRVRHQTTHQSPFGFDERSVLAVHLVVETAGIAEVVAGAVSPPQRRRRGAAVDALATLCARRETQPNCRHPVSQENRNGCLLCSRHQRALQRVNVVERDLCHHHLRHHHHHHARPIFGKKILQRERERERERTKRVQTVQRRRRER